MFIEKTSIEETRSKPWGMRSLLRFKASKMHKRKIGSGKIPGPYGFA